MLAVERQVVSEFVHEHSSKETHVGVASIQHARRRRRTGDLAGIPALDDLAHVLNHHVRGGLLGELVSHPFIDLNEFVFAKSIEFWVRDLDAPDWHGLVEAETGLCVFFTGRALSPRVGTDHSGLLVGHRSGRKRLAQVQLRGIRGEVGAALGLRTKQLLLEPAKLMFELLSLLVRFDDQVDEFVATGLFEIFRRHTC